MYDLNKKKFLNIKKKILTNKTEEPFNEVRLNFLEELSNLIHNNKLCKKFSDLIALSFWLKKKNLLKFKENYPEKSLILSRGVVLHFTPNNVPTNFIYSFVFSFLAGNTNLVRLPSEDFKQVNLILKIINDLKNKKKYKMIFNQNFFFKYSKDEIGLSKDLSELSDVRIIWGGDQSIKDIKKISSKVRSKDIIFSNRYSMCVMNSKKFNSINNIEKSKIIFGFYNDAYGFDQNACTSPHLILWLGDKKNNKIAQNIFWHRLSEYVNKKYDLDIGLAAKRHLFIHEELINNKFIMNLKNYNNSLYVFKLNKIYKDIYKSFKKFGIFFEYEIKNLEEVSVINNHKYQTLTYYGFDKNLLRKKSILNYLNFFDRIVPVGKSMEMEYCWDGYNLFTELTRKVHLI